MPAFEYIRTMLSYDPTRICLGDHSIRAISITSRRPDSISQIHVARVAIIHPVSHLPITANFQTRHPVIVFDLLLKLGRLNADNVFELDDLFRGSPSSLQESSQRSAQEFSIAKEVEWNMLL